jgi:hypothetical protein
MNFTTEAVADGAKPLLFGLGAFTLFILMLLLSTLTGTYFVSWAKRKLHPKEYLHGGKNECYFGSNVSCGQASTVTKVELEALDLTSIEFTKKNLQCYVCLNAIILLNSKNISTFPFFFLLYIF